MIRSDMVEYIAFILDKDISSEAKLVQLFKDKNIFIDNDFYETYIRLKQLYDRIVLIYNNPAKLNQFIATIKKYVTEGKVETFSNFTINPSTFTNFYSLFTKLVNNAEIGDYDTPDLSRSRTIQKYLDVVPATASKYDYYFEGSVTQTLEIEGNGITDYAILPSGKLIYTTTEKNIAIIFDLHDGKTVFEMEYDTKDRASFFLDSQEKDRLIMSSYSQKLIKIWDPIGKELISEIPTQHRIITLDSISKDGVALIIGGFYTGDIVVWNSETEEVVYTFEYTPLAVYFTRVIASIRVVQDKQLIIVQYFSNMIKVYDLCNPQKILTHHPSVTNLTSITPLIRYFPDEVVMFRIEDDIMLWDLKIGKTSKFGEGKEVLVLSNDDFIVRSIKSIDVYSAQRIHKLKIDISEYHSITNMAILPNDTLAVTSDRLLIFDITSGKLTNTFYLEGRISVLGDKISMLYDWKINIYK